MSEILFHYQKVNPTTWVYLSSLLMIGLFFQFNRFWSVRNLDLILLILLAPGLLMVNEARELAQSHGAVQTEIAPVASVGASEVTSDSTSPAMTSPHSLAYVGYLWLFAVSLVWLVRMLADPMMVRRPLLEPNATKGCLVFLGCSLFIFLMANVVTSDPTPDDLKAAEGGA